MSLSGPVGSVGVRICTHIAVGHSMYASPCVDVIDMPHHGHAHQVLLVSEAGLLFWFWLTKSIVTFVKILVPLSK